MKTIKYSKLQAQSRTKHVAPAYKGKKIKRCNVWSEVVYYVLVLKDFNHSIILDLAQLIKRLKGNALVP